MQEKGFHFVLRQGHFLQLVGSVRELPVALYLSLMSNHLIFLEWGKGRKDQAEGEPEKETKHHRCSQEFATDKGVVSKRLSLVFPR